MAISSRLRATTCALAALALLASGGPVGATEDCVDNERRTVIGGGTNGVRSVFAIDMEPDGDIDVLAASANDDKISWYENDGAASFTEHVVTTNADGASAVVAGDLDGDGDADVLSASENDDKIAWYENDGNEPPNFVERVISTTSNGASAVHIADVDGDGDLDVLAASANDDTVAWYASNQLDDPKNPISPPSFTRTPVSTLANGASSVFAADIFLNPDGVEATDDDDDLEILSASRFDDRISWYERRETEDEQLGTIVTYVEYTVDSAADGAAAVMAALIDSDEFVDILSASGNDNKIAWYRSDGADPPSFTKRVISASALGATSVFAADLDGDLDMDVLSASRSDDTVAWYENLGDGDFGSPNTNRKIITSTAHGAASVHAVDLDGDLDGTLDVVVASSVAGTVASDDLIAWHRNDGTPSFEELVISGGAIAPGALLVVDVDGQNRSDVVVASSVDDTIRWYANDGALSPAEPAFTEHLLTLDAPGAADLFWADLDGDGTSDLLAALAGADSVAWYRHLGGGDFGDPQTNRLDISVFQTDEASSVFAIDLDGDDDLDVVATAADDGTLSWFENLSETKPSLDNLFGSEIEIFADAPGAQAVFAVDVDADADIDLVLASTEDDTIRWFESDLTGSMKETPGFTEHLVTDPLNTVFGPRDLFATDMDGDDDVDVVAVSANDDRITWHEQFIDPEDEEMQIQFERHTLPAAVDLPWAVTVADIDDDGDPDIVTASRGDDTVAWHQSDLVQEPEHLDPFFLPRYVTSAADSVRAIGVGYIDDDAALDIVTGFFFEVAWHKGNSEEICAAFDVVGEDGEIDGQELARMSAVFGRFCTDPDQPELDPWIGIDYNRDCQVDGDDLAILSSVDVWGNTTKDCAYTCP